MKKLNNLPIGILIVGLAAATACHAQNRLMLTDVANVYDTNNSTFPTLMQGKDGMLYGTTQTGGAFSRGSIFRCTLSGSGTTLVSFDGTNGASPFSPPVQAADGNFYGTTMSGGPDFDTTNDNGFGYGAIYRMDSNGDLTTIFSFDGTNGAGPGIGNGLIVGNDGALYGVTAGGGLSGDGTIFRITTNGDFTMLASFNGADCSYPQDIIQASDGNFYGTTFYGGTGDSYSFGAVFQMTSGGQINTLFQFNGTNGNDPIGIIQASDGCLYGTTQQGGAFDYQYGGYGTVFKITTNGDFTLLASFDRTNGATPWGLIEVSNGLFYGTTDNYGGGAGAFFQFTTNGDLSALLSFGANFQLPFNPWTSLIKASDGNYYGAAQGVFYGGTRYPTAIFCIRPVQAPVLQAVAQPGQLNLNWNAWAGYSYAVMYETNLTGSNWNLLSTVAPQTNGITSYSDPIGPDTQRFYSVVLQLP